MLTKVMLIEVIYKGTFTKVNFMFLEKMQSKATSVRFISPESTYTPNLDDIHQMLNHHRYIDLVITTDQLEINGISIPKVFINLGKDADQIELFLFLDLADIKMGSLTMNLEYLMSWTHEFEKEYNFDYVICQMDNASPQEYYYDSYGIGPLYQTLD